MTAGDTEEARAEEVLALRAGLVTAHPEVAAVFASLEHHWPKLMNAIESERIPMTNNTTELVIRRFAQHIRTSAVSTASRRPSAIWRCSSRLFVSDSSHAVAQY